MILFGRDLREIIHMKKTALARYVLSVMTIFLLFLGVANAGTSTFKLIKVILLPTTDQGGDAVSYDPSNHCVYVSMGKTNAGGVVINADTNALVKVVRDGLVRPYGMAFDHQYVYWTSNKLEHSAGAGNNTVPEKKSRIFVVNKADWKVVNVFDTVGSGADGIWVDQKLGRLYVAMDDSNWIDVYTLGKAPKFVGKISLYPETGHGPDLGVLLSARHLLYMPDDSWEEKINLLTGQIEDKTNVAPYFPVSATKHHPDTKGQIVDPENHTLWVGTTGSRIFVFNAGNLKVLKQLPARAGIDQVAYDPAYHLVYAFESNAKGFNVYNARTMKPVTFVSTGYGKTHTGAVDPGNHKIFVYVGEAHAVYVYQPVHD